MTAAASQPKPFVLPSRLDGHATRHATPSYEKGDRAPSDAPSTGQRPPIAAVTFAALGRVDRRKKVRSTERYSNTALSHSRRDLCCFGQS